MCTELYETVINRSDDCKERRANVLLSSALTEKKSRGHIPYRNSKLTRLNIKHRTCVFLNFKFYLNAGRILEDSLGGNCKTTMMAMIRSLFTVAHCLSIIVNVSPALMSFNESLSTLKFANRAKNIKNEARINEVLPKYCNSRILPQCVTHQDLDEKTLLRKYEKEVIIPTNMHANTGSRTYISRPFTQCKFWLLKFSSSQCRLKYLCSIINCSISDASEFKFYVYSSRD